MKNALETGLKPHFSHWRIKLSGRNHSKWDDFFFLSILGVVPTSWVGRLTFINFIVTCAVQGRNDVRWRPGQEASLAPPCSKPRSFGSIRSVLKKVLVTLLGLFRASADVGRPHSDSALGNWTPLAPTSLRPWCCVLLFSALLQLRAKSPRQFPHMKMAARSVTQNSDSNKAKNCFEN